MYLPNLEQYEGQSTSELIKLRGKFRTDSLVMAFEEALSSKEVLTDDKNRDRFIYRAVNLHSGVALVRKWRLLSAVAYL